MTRLALILAASLALSSCAGVLKPLTPEQVAAIERDLANAKTAYCAIPEADRAAFREKHHLPVLVICP